MRLRLHSYWRSTAAYRVRIGLALKGVPFETVPVELRRGEQRASAYRRLNPQGLVPALEVDGRVLTQSLPILEWLEELYPEPALLPRDPFGRAHARATAAIIASDVHPLNNLRVLDHLRRDLHTPEPSVLAWAGRWITEGFEAIEPRLADRGWSLGGQPGLVDCCLAPQIYSATRFAIDLNDFPRIARVAALAKEHPAFGVAHPDRQPDADVVAA